MCRVRRGKVAKPKVVKEEKQARARARVELKPLLLLPHPPRKTKWTSLVMIPRLTPLLPKP